MQTDLLGHGQINVIQEQSKILELKGIKYHLEFLDDSQLLFIQGTSISEMDQSVQVFNKDKIRQETTIRKLLCKSGYFKTIHRINDTAAMDQWVLAGRVLTGAKG